MSTQDTRKVVSRVVMDQSFRALLFNDPEQALSGYALTPDETSALRAIPAETIDEFANHLDERISMSVLAFGAEAFGGEAMSGQVMGGKTMGSVATGGRAMGATAASGSVYGGQATGGVVAGSDAYGGEAMAGVTMGSDAYGSVAAGGVAEGAVASGGTAFGGEAMAEGAYVSQSHSASWLARLSAALGFHGGGGSTGEVNYY